MYLVQQTHSNNDKLVAGIVTGILLMLTFFALQVAHLPEVKQRTETYEEIDWTRFKPKPKEIVETPKPVPAPKVENPVKMEDLPEPVPEPVQEQPKKLDLSNLQVFNEQQLDKPARSLERPSTKSTVESGESGAKIDLKKSTMLSGMNSLLGDNATKLQMPKSGRAGRTLSNAPSIRAQSGGAVESSTTNNYGGGTITLGAPEGKDVGGGQVEVAMMNMANFGSNFTDLSELYMELIEWMKRNPAQLSSVVHRFMEYGTGDLTSKVTFQMNGREFDLLILCKENIAEVRVCLLEGRESIYLIDRGFKENSRYLRVGSVNRGGDGNILSFGTVRKEASNSKTNEFYQIFLSWWESVKNS
jgi:hypothetical protein